MRIVWHQSVSQLHGVPVQEMFRLAADACTAGLINYTAEPHRGRPRLDVRRREKGGGDRIGGMVRGEMECKRERSGLI